MPKRDLDSHFEGEKPEWTGRKHRVLGRYVVPAASKMKLLGGHLRLIDGYAGPNRYGGEVTGSTWILLNAAETVIGQGGHATVYACEPDRDRFAILTAGLSTFIDKGLLVAIPNNHSDALATLMKEARTDPAIVFLDPQAPSEMLLKRDIDPWARRRKTDVLGVFMATGASRVAARAQGVHGGQAEKATAEAVLGSNWKHGKTVDGAFEVMSAELAQMKRFAGLYRLRKRDIKSEAYGIFGVSDSSHGFHLLSDAVARDFGQLKEFDRIKAGPGLFDSEERQEEEQADMNLLLSLVAPILESNPALTGQKLAVAVYDLYGGQRNTFGRFAEPDFTKAAKVWRANNGKA